MIKGIIFDMDGVLIEAKDWHYEALNQALRSFGYEITQEAHLNRYDGLPTKKKLEMLSLESDLSPTLHQRIYDLKQKYTMEMVDIYCKPRFDHEFALSVLKSEGYHLAIASNSIRVTIETMLKKANLLRHFDFILSNQDVKRPKPDPEIYQKAIQALQLWPHECLVIEDNEHGIKAALSANAYVMRVKEVCEVTYENIKNHIRKIENTGIRV